MKLPTSARTHQVSQRHAPPAMEDDGDHGDYISQLRAEFDSCDASASGLLGRDELTALCRKLRLEAHLQRLLDALLERRACGRVSPAPCPPRRWRSGSLSRVWSSGEL